MLRINLRDSCSAARYDFFLWRYGLGQANQIATHLTNLEKEELFLLARRLRPKIVVEVGSYLGCSSSFLAAALYHFVPRSTLFCVDTWQNETMPEGRRDTYDEFLTNTQRFKDIIKPIRSRSTDAARHFDKKIDLLFIDGDHEFEAVKDDWTHWSPHLNSGATVVMHDIQWAEGVQRVVADEIQPRAVQEKFMPNLYWATLASS